MKGRRLHLRCRISFREWDNKSKSDIVSDIRCRDRHQQRQHKYISFSFGFILVAACLHKAHLSVGRRHPRVYRWRCTAHNANHPNEQHSKRDDSINLYDFRWHLAQRAKPILMVPSNVCVCVLVSGTRESCAGRWMKVWTYSAPTFEGPRKLRRLIYDTRMKSCSINLDFVRVPGNYSHCHAVVEFCLSVCLRAIGVRPQNSIDGKSSGREATEHKAPSARLSEIAHPIFLRTLEDIKSHVRLICALFFSFDSTRTDLICINTSGSFILMLSFGVGNFRN